MVKKDGLETLYTLPDEFIAGEKVGRSEYYYIKPGESLKCTFPGAEIGYNSGSTQA